VISKRTENISIETFGSVIILEGNPQIRFHKFMPTKAVAKTTAHRGLISVRPRMNRHEFIAIVFGIFSVALYIASCVLSIAFLVMHRENRWRWLPCISVIALPLIEIVPESGWSDGRSQWHQTALGVVWSIWALYLAFILLKTGRGRVSIALRSVLGIMGVFGVTAGTISLFECWRFLHSL
jgi:hypothetical protein